MEDYFLVFDDSCCVVFLAAQLPLGFVFAVAALFR